MPSLSSLLSVRRRNFCLTLSMMYDPCPWGKLSIRLSVLGLKVWLWRVKLCWATEDLDIWGSVYGKRPCLFAGVHGCSRCTSRLASLFAWHRAFLLCVVGVATFIATWSRSSDEQMLQEPTASTGFLQTAHPATSSSVSFPLEGEHSSLVWFSYQDVEVQRPS